MTVDRLWDSQRDLLDKTVDWSGCRVPYFTDICVPIGQWVGCLVGVTPSLFEIAQNRFLFNYCRIQDRRCVAIYIRRYHEVFTWGFIIWFVEFPVILWEFRVLLKFRNVLRNMKHSDASRSVASLYGWLTGHIWDGSLRAAIWYHPGTREEAEAENLSEKLIGRAMEIGGTCCNGE